MATYHKKKELIIGIAMVSTALGYLAISLKLPSHAGVDAASVPILLSAMLFLLAMIQLFAAFATPKLQPPPPFATEEPANIFDLRTVIKTLALILAYIALLSPIGFPIMTAAYLYLQFIVLTPVDHKVRHFVYAVIAVLTSGIIYVLFREAFDLMLPAGLLDY